MPVVIELAGFIRPLDDMSAAFDEDVGLRGFLPIAFVAESISLCNEW